MKHLLLIFSLLICYTSQAQDEFPYWNHIKTEDLKMTTYEADTSAAAVYLLNYGKAKYDIYLNKSIYAYEYHYQIKILKKSAFFKSNIEFTFPKRYPVIKVKAVVHNWENGKKVSTEVTDFYKEKVSKYTRSITFSFPNVKVGSIIEYRFTDIYPNIVSPPKFYFQKEYPVKFAEFHFAFDSYYSYQSVSPKVNITGKGDKTYFINPPGYQEIPITEYFWQAENIVALPEEPFVNNILDYRESLTMQLSSYRNRQTNRVKEYLSTWDKLAKSFRDDEGKLYNKSNKLKSIIEQTDFIVNEATTQKEKVTALFQFVQANIEWNESYRRYTSDDFKTTIKNGNGNSADINLILLGLLKHYKIDANPILISTKDNGRITKSYSFIGQFNHVILQVMIDEKPVYIDAIDPTYPINILPKNSICPEGFMITKNAFEWVKIPSKKSEIINLMQLKIKEAGQLEGTLTQQHKVYAAHDLRMKMAKLEEEKYKATIFNNSISDYEISDFKQENLFENIDKPVKTSGNITINDAAQVNGDYIYINPFLGLVQTENPFQSESRNLPIELPYKESKQVIVYLDVPEGYEVESLPENVSYRFPDSKSQFLLASKLTNNKIQILSKVNLVEPFFNPSFYEAVQKFNDIIVEKHNQQIVLKKK